MLARWPKPAFRGLKASFGRRAFYYTESQTTDDPRVTTLNMYGDNGQYRFDMNIFNHNQRNNDSPLIIYLSSNTTPSPHPHFSDFYIPESLIRKFRVARINYRWDSNFPFPTPVHDVSTGYDEIVKNLCTSKTKLGVYGRYLGGTLATSLALTESKKKNPRGSISALVATNAIFDWTNIPEDEVVVDTSMKELQNLETERPRRLMLDIWRKDAIIMRKSLFANPGQCFDPFASPILFFRNAGREVPEEFTTDFIKRDPEYEYSSSESTETESTKTSEELTVDMEVVSKSLRKSHMRFPPKNSDLLIPKSRITVGGGGWMGSQGRELVKLMRRSVTMFEMKERGDWDVDAEEEAVGRVGLVDEGVEVEGVLRGEDREVEWLEEVLDG